ncbi:restriction endonuclease subunit S [Streptomyces sp. NPDC001404]|uniref:restriction endonuclease subunit S n=1 Tax=Streptomyces sp. NPDC001404 TaxID=3364571 RepID=UPI0036A349BD
MSGDLPEGWVRVRLGDILDRIEAGKSYKCEPRPADPEEWGVIKVSAMTWGEFDESENKAVPAGYAFTPDYEINPGDILLSRANTPAYVGASVLVKSCRPQLLLSDKSLRLVPASGIDREWLAYLLSSPSIRDQISAQATGTKDSMRNISQGALADLNFWLPPLAEQQRIVATLEEQLSRLEEACSSVASAVDKCTALRASMLRSLREAAIKGGSPLHPLGGIADTSLGKMLDKRKNSGTSTPYLRNINVRWGHFDLSDVRTIPMNDAELERFTANPGDLLVCEGGEPGRCAVWPDTQPPIAYQKALHRVRPHDGVSAHWIALMLEEATLSRRFNHLLTGTTIKHIPQEKLRSVEIPVPSTGLQAQLLRKSEKAADYSVRLMGQLERSLTRAADIRRSLLTEAFAGRLVPQDPSDEPAEVLLARIRAEREAAAPRKRARRTPTQRKGSDPTPPPAPTATTPLAGEQTVLDLPLPDLEITS